MNSVQQRFLGIVPFYRHGFLHDYSAGIYILLQHRQKFQRLFYYLSNLNVPRQNEPNIRSRAHRRAERPERHGRPWTAVEVRDARWEGDPSTSGWIVRSEFAWSRQGRLSRRLPPEVRCLALGHSFHGLGSLCG